MIDTLSGLEIQESAGLVGSKYAIQCGHVLFISPAMWSLMQNATQDELDHLMANIPVREIPPLAMALACLELHRQNMLPPG